MCHVPFFQKKRSSTANALYTEVHCHILPGIDDGAQEVEQSVTLISQMRQWGISNIIATPHVEEFLFTNDHELIEAAYQRLTNAVNLEEWGISLAYSAEYRMDTNFERIMRRDEIIPLPHRHVLIENSFLQPYWNIKALIFELQNANFTPILAHPERYVYYQNEKHIYNDLHERGCEFQVNLLSLAGGYTRRTKEIAEWLIEKRLADYLGSDLHNIQQALLIEQYLTKREFAKLRQTLHLKNDDLF